MRNIFFLLSLIWISGFAEEAHESGTLMISYQTNQSGERLDRVRVWLTGENGRLHTFPKGQAFAEDPSIPSRTIMISDLPSGSYTLEFVIPNRDRFFEELPPKELLIAAGQILKLSQTISPRNETGQTLSPQNIGSLAVRYAFQEQQNIHFQLINEKGHVRKGPSAEDFIQQCDEHNCYLLVEEIPAGKYQLVFYVDSAASPLVERSVEIKGGEDLFIFVH